MSTEEKNKDPETISENPVNVLFNTSSIAKKDVWEIDIVGILEMLLRILGKSGKKDLRVAGMAALSSSLIYRMKVESIFALHRAAMEKKSSRVRSDVDIPLLLHLHSNTIDSARAIEGISQTSFFAIDDVLKRTFTGFSEIVSGSLFFSSVLI